MTFRGFVYLLVIFALQSVLLFHSSSDVVSENAYSRQLADELKQRSWVDALHVNEAQRQVALSKAPRFMVDLYKKNLRNPALLLGHAVRSFSGHSDGSFLFFNLTSVGQGEKIIKAEFRWFWCVQPFLSGHHFYKVNLYEVLERQSKPFRGNLITSRLLSVYSRGWEVFNVTQMVTKWICNNSSYNSILFVSILPLGHWLETIRTVQMEKLSGIKENHAYVVIYTDDGQRISGQNTELPFQFLDHKITRSQDHLQTLVRRRRSTGEILFNNEQSFTCQRKPLYVDFAKLGWSGWIISPRGYNAYHCTGSCPFPLSENFHATNHAIVQSIVNTLKITDQVGRPCCVPDVLFPISILYFDNEENVVLKQYDHMVAGNCGCH